MKEDGPDRQAVVRHIDFFKVAAVVRTAVRAFLGAHIDDFRLFGMDCNGPDFRRLRQAVTERFPLAGPTSHAVQTRLNFTARRRFTGKAGVHIGCRVG